MRTNNIVSRLTLVLLLFAVSACGPRGETKNLSEVLQISKNRFQEAVKSSGENKGGQLVSSATRLLDQMISTENSEQLKGQCEALADKLSSLLDKSGYTQRPAMAELASQYRNLAVSENQHQISAAQIKLLASRTYHLLASELETTNFGM